MNQDINYCKQSYTKDHSFVNIGVEIGQLPQEGFSNFKIVCAYCGQVRAINDNYDVKVVKESGNVEK